MDKKGSFLLHGVEALEKNAIAFPPELVGFLRSKDVKKILKGKGRVKGRTARYAALAAMALGALGYSGIADAETKIDIEDEILSRLGARDMTVYELAKKLRNKDTSASNVDMPLVPW